MRQLLTQSLFFFFNDTATTEIYTLSLHDALPICSRVGAAVGPAADRTAAGRRTGTDPDPGNAAAPALRSEEHTSELQSQSNLVCRLLLEKKKENTNLYKQQQIAEIIHKKLTHVQT